MPAPRKPPGTCKRNTLFRLSPEAIEQIDSLTALLGCSRVAIVEDAIADMYADQLRRSAAIEAAAHAEFEAKARARYQELRGVAANSPDQGQRKTFTHNLSN